MGTETYKMDNALALVEVFVEVIPECAAFCSETLLALASEKLHGQVMSLLKLPVEDLNMRNEGREEKTLRNLRRKLVAATVSMLLTVTVANQSSHKDLNQKKQSSDIGQHQGSQSSDKGLPQNVVLQLIKKQQSLLQDTPLQCHEHIVRANPIAHTSLFEQPCTQWTAPSQGDLGDRIRTEMARLITHQSESVTRIVRHNCHDLERRLLTVEEPLRRERDKNKALTEEVTRLEEKLAELRKESEIDKECLTGCEAERDEFSDKNRLLEEKLEQVQRDLKDAHEQAQEALRQAHSDHKAVKFQLRSTITAQEEKMASLQEQLKALEEQLQAKDENLTEELRQKETLQSTCESLSSQVQILTENLARERKSMAEQTDELQGLRAALGDLGSRFESVTKEMEVVSEQKDALEAQHQELLRSSEGALKDVETNHTSRMEAAAAKFKEEQDRLQMQLEGVIAERERALKFYEDARKDLEAAQETVKYLEQKVSQRQITPWKEPSTNRCIADA